MSERISKELAKYIIDRDIRLAIEQAYSEKPNKKINCELALDIAIESLEREEIKDPEDLYLGIDIAIKILEKQRDKVEPYERKE